MRIIYGDSLFFLNFIVDYLLLSAAAKLCSLPVRRLRWSIGATFGGLYAVLAVAFPRFFAMVTVKLAAGTATALMGLGVRRPGRSVLCFFAVSAAFGGMVSAMSTLFGLEANGSYVSVNLGVLTGAFGLCYCAVSLVFRGCAAASGRRIVPVRLTIDERSVEIKALYDTGNELRDPVTGLPAIVADAKAAEMLFPPECRAYLADDAADALLWLRQENCPGSPRLIFGRSAGSAGRAMLCFSLKEAVVEGKPCKYCLALAPALLSGEGDYGALINYFGER